MKWESWMVSTFATCEHFSGWWRIWKYCWSKERRLNKRVYYFMTAVENVVCIQTRDLRLISKFIAVVLRNDKHEVHSGTEYNTNGARKACSYFFAKKKVFSILMIKAFKSLIPGQNQSENRAIWSKSKCQNWTFL